MAEKMPVTNAMRLLRAAGIAFEVRTYPVDESDLSGVHAAQACGLPVEQVFKTLVLKGEKKGFMVCVLPVAAEVDLKKLAAAAGDKKVEMLPLRDLTSITGYLRGGCSPVGMKKKFPTYLEKSAENFDRIAVSAGQRGVQMLLDPRDLARYTSAVLCDVAQQGAGS